MKILEPSYYKEFKCIADKCKDTCCIGWRVTIDKASYLKYEETKGEFGERLSRNIRKNINGKNNGEYGEFVLDKNMRCPLLNENNLCDIHINKGVDYLCYVCAAYPKNVEIYGDIAERNLTVSCPSVAQILVDKKERIDFLLKEKVEHNKNQFIININKRYEEYYDLVWEGRSLSIDIAQFREIPIWKRLSVIKLIGDRIQSIINNAEACNVTEFINDLKNEVFSESFIESLDYFEKTNTATKINLILMVFEILNNQGIRILLKWWRM